MVKGAKKHQFGADIALDVAGRGKAEARSWRGAIEPGSDLACLSDQLVRHSRPVIADLDLDPVVVGSANLHLIAEA